MSASEPPELPEPPEVDYRRPAWIEPPADVVPGIVAVELVLARTPQRAIGLTGIRAYPTRFGCTLHLRLRDVIPGEQSQFGMFNMFGDQVDPAGESATTRAPGHAASRMRSRTPRCCTATVAAAGTAAGVPPTGCGACRHPGRWPSSVRGPARHIPESQVEIDAGLVLEAAGRAAPVWPAG